MGKERGSQSLSSRPERGRAASRAPLGAPRRYGIQFDILAGLALGLLFFLVSRKLPIAESIYSALPTLGLDGWMLRVSIAFAILSGVAVYFLRHMFGMQRELSRRSQAADEAIHLSRHDPLTGVANRRGFDDALAEALAESDGPACRVGLVLVDLDRFKEFNDIYGHEVGDGVLIEVARRLTRAVGAAGVVGRLGGDEFAAVIRFDQGSLQALRTELRMAEAMREPVRVGKLHLDLTFSIGAATNSTIDLNAEELFRRADAALYRSKSEGPGRFNIFDISMEVEFRQRLDLTAELPEALRNGEIIPVFRPIGDLRHGLVSGFEASPRWVHPVHGVVEPERVSAAAEQAGLAGELALAVCHAACMAARDWPRHLALTVDLTALNCRDTSIPEQVLAILLDTGFDRKRLEILVSENTVASAVEPARRTLAFLKAQGLRIVMADFASGPLGLRRFREMPVDRVRIDKNLLLSLGSRDSGQHVARAIVELCLAMNLEVEVDNLDSVEAAEWMAALGCAFGRGPLFGPLVEDIAAVDARIVPALYPAVLAGGNLSA